MNPHPYLRAYLAGIFVPTLLLPLMLLAFLIVRLGLQAPFPIERGLVFPLALISVLWGLWNMLWLASHRRTDISIGLHGLLLPFLLLPAGVLTARCLGLLTLGVAHVTWFQSIRISYALVMVCFLFALAGYYLVWKYIVGWVNRILGIA